MSKQFKPCGCLTDGYNWLKECDEHLKLRRLRERVIDECIEACKREYLEDPQKDTEDEVYDDAIKHCVDALHAIKRPHGNKHE